MPPDIRRALSRLARAHLRAQVWRFPLSAAVALPLYWTIEASLDLVLNLSWAARAGFLGAGLILLAGLFFWQVVIPYRRRLNLRAAALLVERKFPVFRSSLISAVDFTSRADGLPPQSTALVDILLQQVNLTLGKTDLVRGIVDQRPLQRLTWKALLVVVAVACLVGYFRPQSIILARRIFLSREVLPSRTTVVPLTQDFSVDVGSNVELAARARGVVPRNGRVTLVYADGHPEAIPVAVSPVEPGVFRLTLHNILQPFRYHFEINDGATADSRVTTRHLPALASTRFTYQPPSYTHLPSTELPSGSLTLLADSRLVIEGEATQTLRSATLELKGLNRTLRMFNGDWASNLRQLSEDNEARLKAAQLQMDKLRPDVDAATAGRDAAQQALARAEQARQAVPSGDARRQLDFKWELAGGELQDAQGYLEQAKSRYEKARAELENARHESADLKKQLDGALAQPPPDKETAAKRKRQLHLDLPIPKEGLTGLSIHLVNEEGLASVNDPVYRVNVTIDKPPTVEITEPKAERKTVLAGDKVLVKFRARDDYRIERIDLHYIVLRPNADGVAVPAEEQTLQVPFPAGTTTFAGEYLMDLGSFVPSITEGSSVTCWFVASDYFTLYNNGGGVSRKLILAVVSPEEKKAELIAEMQKTARAIQNLAEHQNKANEKSDSSFRK